MLYSYKYSSSLHRMADYQASFNNRLRELSNSRSLASNQSDNTIGAAKLIGTFNRSSTPTTLQYRDKVGKSDRIDFLRIDLAPTAGFSSTRNLIKIKGGNINITTSIGLPGAPLQTVDVSNFGSGSNVIESNTPFSNVFGTTTQLFFRIQLARPRSAKKVSYRIKLTFNP